MGCRPFVAALLAALPCTAASADVVIQSSLVQVWHQGAFHQPPWDSWNDTASSSGVGAVTVTTPRGQSFSATITPQLIAGTFSGSGYSGGGSNPGGSSHRRRIDVNFAVTGSAAEVRFLFNGDMFPTGNADLSLINRANGTVVFSAMNIVTYENPWVTWAGCSWTDVWWSLTLPPGEYLLTGFGAPNQMYSAGGGSGASGGGTLVFSMTLTPTPSSAIAVSLLLGSAARRRRR